MPDKSEKKSDFSFLPARKSAVFTYLFEWYCDWLFRRRFASIDIRNNYRADPGKKTIYYLNHSSWWDGLIPFHLNQKIFRQSAYAMMEDKQLHRYPFFRFLGVFSIDLSSLRSSIPSMRYAIESIKRPGTSLFIYPQGKIVPFTSDHLKFKKGIGWLAKKIPEADIVPVAIYIHTQSSDKPRLEILVGNAIEIDRNQRADKIINTLENELSILLKQLAI